MSIFSWFFKEPPVKVVERPSLLEIGKIKSKEYLQYHRENYEKACFHRDRFVKNLGEHPRLSFAFSGDPADSELGKCSPKLYLEIDKKRKYTLYFNNNDSYDNFSVLSEDNAYMTWTSKESFAVELWEKLNEPTQD